MIAFFQRQEFLDAHAAADMLGWENSGFSIDASVRITLLDRDVPSYFQSLEHLLRSCARPPFALEWLSVIRDADGRITRIRYVMPRHWMTIWAANRFGPGRQRTSTQPGAGGVIDARAVCRQDAGAAAWPNLGFGCDGPAAAGARVGPAAGKQARRLRAERRGWRSAHAEP